MVKILSLETFSMDSISFQTENVIQGKNCESGNIE